MKKLFLFLLIITIGMIVASDSHAQCPYDNTLYLYGDAPANVGESVLAPQCWGGDLLQLTNLHQGYTYRISGCASATFDSEITIYPSGGGNFLAFDDDGCGTLGGPSSIDFVCPADGDYDVLIDEYPCSNGFTDMDITIELISTGATSGSDPISIPVVVHVLYNNTQENISDEQILSQISRLNADYQKMNDDFNAVVPAAFQGVAADCNIQFCPASVDPFGNATSGITRTFTNVTQFLQDNSMKHSNTGGHDNWDPSKYLNIWVCNLGDGLLGYATFPADLQSDPSNDGVVILYKAFGSIGDLHPDYNLGRTATHEVGHWLNLRHIWGDANCGDDFVNDTPTQQTSNVGCPNYPHSTCGNGPNGDMFVNYMDYVNDACMAMFSQGQKSRIDATMNGSRVMLKSSGGCGVSTGIPQVETTSQMLIYPNPNNGTFSIQTKEATFVHPEIVVFDRIGRRISNVRINNISSNSIDLSLQQKVTGIYFITITEGSKEYHAQFILE